MTDDNKPQVQKVNKDPLEKQKKLPKEVNGRGGLEPTRYDDWEIKGKCVDF